MDEWYEELDFEENPFSVNPSEYLKSLVGRDEILDELDYRIRSGSIVFVEGPRGSGRSSLLRAMVRRFRGRGRVIYVNAEKFEKKLDIEDLLVQRNGFFKGMLLKKKPKRMILFIDNVDSLSHRNTERLKHYFDENYLQSVVFTGESFEKAGFSESLRLRIEGRVINIPKMKDDQVVQMVRNRVGDTKLLSQDLILDVASRYDNNPKEVLKALDEVAEFVVSLDEDVITKKHLDEVLQPAEKPGKPKKTTKKDTESSKGNSEVTEEKEVSKMDEASTSEESGELHKGESSAAEMVEMLEEYDDSGKVEKEEVPASASEAAVETDSEKSVSTKDEKKNEARAEDDDELDDIDAFFDEVEEDAEQANTSVSEAVSEKEKAVVGGESESKQSGLDKHVMVEEEAVESDEKKTKDDEIFDDDFFLEDDDEKAKDYSEDDDIFDEFFEDDDEENR